MDSVKIKKHFKAFLPPSFLPVPYISFTATLPS